MKKIAILGTAPSSKWKAPFDDPSWEIWACSPGNVDLPKVDVWFEIHEYIWKDPNHQTFVNLMKKQAKVYTNEVREDIPGSVRYPLEDMIKEFSPYFFTSSGSYMMALAIKEKPDVIGIFGMDMQSENEYRHQRPGMHFFIREAKRLGIEVVVPPESEILQPPPFYGYCETNPMFIKLSKRKEEFENKLRQAKYDRQVAEQTEIAFGAAIKDLDYILRTWI